MYHLRKPLQQCHGRSRLGNQRFTQSISPHSLQLIGETEIIAEYSQRHDCQRKGDYKLVD